MNSHIVPEVGVHECTRVGTCKFIINLQSIYIMYSKFIDVLQIF